MMFDAEEFRELAKKDFDEAWHAGKEVLDTPPVSQRYPRMEFHRAKPHPIAETIERLRQAYLMMGFDEARVPVFIDESDVYKQFGPEASAVLDRVFYLGGLPRPNVGIGKKQLDQIAEILGKPLDAEVEENLRKKLHSYKKSEIDGDELTYELSVVLGTDDGLVVRIMDEVFPEFRELCPESSRTTLRSHMTSGWFMTLGEIWDKVPLPIRQFSIDRCFRREQEEGPTRLMTYHSASCIIAGEGVSVEDGKAVAASLLSAFGFTDFEFRPDEKRSKYYVPDTQTEVYAKHPVHGWVEVATFGIYSPHSLAAYGVEVPVMNLGLGVERLAMIEYEAEDVRALTHPQFFPQSFSDLQIARSVFLKEEPESCVGVEIAEAISAVARENADAISPCEFLAWKSDSYCGCKIKVFVYEDEENSKLLGPAALNDIFVVDGKILGLPDTKNYKKQRDKGVDAHLSFIEAIANLAASRIEEAVFYAESGSVDVKMVKVPSELNLSVEPWAMRFITDNNKKVDVRGPVFTAVRWEIEECECECEDDECHCHDDDCECGDECTCGDDCACGQ
ncbi:O-phosphoserine--tRNA ligase [Methanoplanus sp. FWC-SCC4]|uniref:O-phosphoserine--tRNA(Cys) ligase n=1 Tax=Methanochimaera problematica TaxID=2609417 RepID=A0AA97FCX1_9EURY|nr:O-phosphoserine--tRNA ligase [Methanoplanus sp. FWC-SCC4]WOF16644.1 O-phosphoserine--tRNA ligase [Methanoplanus sp. FWC-SCC4]